MDALTDAERQVVGLATRGLTNRQISDRLTLSRRTVETHLAHAYQKLAIHSRAELAGVAHRTVESDILNDPVGSRTLGATSLG